MIFDQEFANGELFKWVVLPLIIFCARMCDVTLGTLRNVFIARGLRKVVPVVAFFEVMIWLLSIRQILQHLDNPMCYIGFAGGYAMGTYVGMYVDRTLALGYQVMRIITGNDALPLITALQKENVGLTIMDGHGAKGPVKILFTIVKRKDVPAISAIIQEVNPAAFYSVEDVRSANMGVFKKGGDGKLDTIRQIFPDPQ